MVINHWICCPPWRLLGNLAPLTALLHHIHLCRYCFAPNLSRPWKYFHPSMLMFSTSHHFPFSLKIWLFNKEIEGHLHFYLSNRKVHGARAKSSSSLFCTPQDFLYAEANICHNYVLYACHVAHYCLLILFIIIIIILKNTSPLCRTIDTYNPVTLFKYDN